MSAGTPQLGFDALLDAADSDNRARQFDRDTAHLPDTMEEGIAFFRDLIVRNHEAMLAADVDEVKRLHEQAYLLALRLNGGENGILAHENAPGCVLERESAAPVGTVPLWGQSGAFVMELWGMRVRIEMDGLFGIGSSHCVWPGFAAHAVDWDKPFLSETGYRSFLGVFATPQEGYTPDIFARDAILAYIEHGLRGKLVAIEARYRDRGNHPDT